MNIPLVYAITLNSNRRVDALECLGSLTQITSPKLRILVIDNGSTDGSPQSITEKFPSVEQIVNASNVGFSAGFNIGLRRALEAKADYALILNNDSLVAPNMLEPLITAIKPEDVGITAPAIYYASNPEQVWSTGGGRNPLTLEMTGDHGRHETLIQITEREFLSGCGMLIKRSVIERVGLFDENFFLYYEDSDYCLRTRKAGFRLLVVPQARMWHKVSASTNGSDSPMERYWMGYSGVRFFRKHARPWQVPFIILWRLGSTVKIVVRLAHAGRSAAARAFVRGVWEGLKSN